MTVVEVRNEPFTKTSVPEVKPVPAIVKVKLGLPEATEGGERLIIESGTLAVL